MKLSFVAEGSPDCPILMLRDFTRAEAGRLRRLAGALADGRRTSEKLDADSEEGLTLQLVVADRDLGIPQSLPHFTCALRKASWSNIEGLLEPFADGFPGFQWLSDFGEVRWLMSRTGAW
jgi:hypothetical protein